MIDETANKLEAKISIKMYFLLWIKDKTNIKAKNKTAKYKHINPNIEEKC